MTITNSSKCIACGGYHYMDGLPCPMYTITDVPTVTFNEYSYNSSKWISEDEQDAALLKLMQSNHCKLVDFPDGVKSEEDFIKWIKENN